MLNELHIENIAVIEKADISFSRGLNILTGETGAGKSIVIDSIGAVLGERVSRELVRRGAEKGLVTAAFDVDGCEDWLRENEIDAEDELIIQRRIAADGKSSCRVCGNPVTAAQLKELAALLVDIHGQNDGRQLMDERGTGSIWTASAPTRMRLNVTVSAISIIVRSKKSSPLWRWTRSRRRG